MAETVKERTCRRLLIDLAIVCDKLQRREYNLQQKRDEREIELQRQLSTGPKITAMARSLSQGNVQRSSENVSDRLYKKAQDKVMQEQMKRVRACGRSVLSAQWYFYMSICFWSQEADDGSGGYSFKPDISRSQSNCEAASLGSARLVYALTIHSALRSSCPVKLCRYLALYVQGELARENRDRLAQALDAEDAEVNTYTPAVNYL